MKRFSVASKTPCGSRSMSRKRNMKSLSNGGMVVEFE
jgi:hypothetical protein